MTFSTRVASSFQSTETDQMVWINFEEGLRAKCFRLADIEFAEKQTSVEISEDQLKDYFWLHERYQEGDLFALFDVINKCDQLQTPLPIWAAEAIKKAIVNGVLGREFEEKKKGRHSTLSRVFSDELKSYLRYDAVRRIRDYQALGPCLFSYWSWSSPGFVDGYGLRDSSPSAAVLS